jgi:hypothetical protein
MYEMFTKRFIDLLDERAPVTKVHILHDTPLGSVESESFTIIHCRLDLTDEDSPFAEIEVFPLAEDHFELICDLTLPPGSLSNDEADMVRSAQALHEGAEVYEVRDVVDGGREYDIHMEFEFEATENASEMDEEIEGLVEVISGMLRVGGYEPQPLEELIHT